MVLKSENLSRSTSRIVVVIIIMIITKVIIIVNISIAMVSWVL